MAIKGKVLGAGLGAFLLGPLGAAAGVLVGQAFDSEAEGSSKKKLPVNDNGQYDPLAGHREDRDVLGNGHSLNMDDGNYYEIQDDSNDW